MKGAIPNLIFTVQLSVYKATVSYISSQEKRSSLADPFLADSSHIWRRKLSRLLESYPHLANKEEEEEEEDSQDLVRDLCENAPEEVDFSLSSSDGEEEEEEEEGGVAAVLPQRSTRSMALQKKSKVTSHLSLQNHQIEYPVLV